VNESDFTGRLTRGEKLIWWGQPQRGLLVTSSDWLLVPFSLVWGGFAIFWEAGVLRVGHWPETYLMAVFGLPFVLIGLYLIFGRFIVDAWMRDRTGYALTDKRILILRTGPFAKFSAINLDQLPDATLSETSGGRGTIRFGTTGIFRGRGNASWGGWTPSVDATQFIGIEDARRVFDRIQQLSTARNRES